MSHPRCLTLIKRTAPPKKKEKKRKKNRSHQYGTLHPASCVPPHSVSSRDPLRVRVSVLFFFFPFKMPRLVSEALDRETCSLADPQADMPSFSSPLLCKNLSLLFSASFLRLHILSFPNFVSFSFALSFFFLCYTMSVQFAPIEY